jgi:hypothetical protein
MIAEHVASKAVRDALFLSTFESDALPLMFVVAAIASLVLVPFVARVLSAYGPAKVVTPAFVVSAVLLATTWALASLVPRAAAVSLYLHVAAIDAVLISWFWSLINERFDPRTAKREMRRMMGGATLGGLAGGVLAERTALFLDGRAMILILAALHVACALTVAGLAHGAPLTDPKDRSSKSGFELFRGSPYAQKLALLVLLTTVAASLLDYAFKAQAAATFGGGPALLRFFGLFYAGTGLLTFVLQTLLSHVVLTRLGLASAVGSLPLAVTFAGVGALLLPGLPAFTVLRAAEASLQSSLHRSGYELFFTPMPAAEKRALKTFIDVGFARIGDAFGGGLLKLLLALLGAAALSSILGLAVALSIAALVVAVQLHRGYVRTLEKRLEDGAFALDAAQILDSTTKSVLATFAGAPRAETPPPRPRVEVDDPHQSRGADLRSRDLDRVLRALAEPLPPSLAAEVIPLLAWDDAAPAVLAALAPIADEAVSTLARALLSPDEEFAVRRRLPRVLEHGRSPEVLALLLSALDDRRFEVRYRCGRALARIHERAPDVAIDRARIFAAVIREAAIDRGVWESQRLLDEEAATGEHEFIDELLRDRASRSLEHVFTLLSLAFPRRPLVIAFRALHTSNAHLRGTALEYLEGILPAEVRKALWPYLEDRGATRPRDRARDQVLEELLQSNASIQMNLEEARKKREAGG